MARRHCSSSAVCFCSLYVTKGSMVWLVQGHRWNSELDEGRAAVHVDAATPETVRSDESRSESYLQVCPETCRTAHGPPAFEFQWNTPYHVYQERCVYNRRRLAHRSRLSEKRRAIYLNDFEGTYKSYKSMQRTCKPPKHCCAVNRRTDYDDDDA
jgi:hypothetical protein